MYRSPAARRGPEITDLQWQRVQQDIVSNVRFGNDPRRWVDLYGNRPCEQLLAFEACRNPTMQGIIEKDRPTIIKPICTVCCGVLQQIAKSVIPPLNIWLDENRKFVGYLNED